MLWRIVRNLRFVLLSLAVAGPAIAISSWLDERRVEHVLATGVDAQAQVEGGTRTTRRSSSSYTLNLSWRGADGATVEGRNVPISSVLADRLFHDGLVRLERFGIRYDPDDTAHPVIIEDAARQADKFHFLVRVGIGLTIVGWLFAIILLVRWRREKARSGPLAA